MAASPSSGAMSTRSLAFASGSSGRSAIPRSEQDAKPLADTAAGGYPSDLAWCHRPLSPPCRTGEDEGRILLPSEKELHAMKRTMVRLGVSLALLVTVVGLVPRAEAGITPYNPCRTYDNNPTGCYYTWSP